MKKQFYVQSEMIQAGQWGPSSNPNDVDEILFSVHGDDDRYVWEGFVSLIRLSKNHCAMRLKLFDDAWIAFKDAPEVFQLLAKHQKPSGEDSSLSFEALIQELKSAGWTRHKPEQKPAVQETCHACGKAKD